MTRAGTPALLSTKQERTPSSMTCGCYVSKITCDCGPSVACHFHQKELFLMVGFCPVTVPPTIRGTDSDFPDEVTVLVNKTTQLECHVDGNPAPKITWIKDNQPVSLDGPHRILSNGRTLQVTIWKHRWFWYVSLPMFAFRPILFRKSEKRKVPLNQTHITTIYPIKKKCFNMI